MYNRYIPQDGFVPVEPTADPPRPASAPSMEQREGQGGLLARLLRGSGLSSLTSLTSGITGSVGGLLERLGLGKLDKGDLLLLLVLVYLFQESEDEEWLIILALVLLMGL